MKKINLFIIILGILSSCSKNSDLPFKKGIVQKNLPSFESLFNYLNNSNVSGRFLLQSNTSLGMSDISKIPTPININGGFFASNSSTERKAGGEAKFENIAISCTQDPSYHKEISYDEGKLLFGKKISVSLIKPESVAQGVVSNPATYQTNYIPQIFNCSNVFQENIAGSDGAYISGTKIAPGYQFTWNVDSENQKGVFIFFEYDPNDPINNLVKSNFPKKASNGILVDDIGSYTLTQEMFADIPLNAKLNVYMGRGNFQYLANSDGTASDVQFTAISYKYGNLYYGNQ